MMTFEYGSEFLIAALVVGIVVGVLALFTKVRG